MSRYLFSEFSGLWSLAFGAISLTNVPAYAMEQARLLKTEHFDRIYSKVSPKTCNE
ncbi:MAG: hypothetical protein AB4041_01970 [Microcystaceae cyanobacterium]